MNVAQSARVFARLGAARRGILWMLATTLVFVAMDAMGKYLSGLYPVNQVVWARFAFHVVALAVVFRRRLWDYVPTRRPGLQAARAVFLLGSTSFAFLALKVMPLADVSAFWTLVPVMVTALSLPLLGEPVGMRRWAGVGVAFLGALLIVRPGSGILQWGMGLALLSAACQALYSICTRALSPHDRPLTTLIHTTSVGLLATSASLAFWWAAPDALGWVLMVTLGALGSVGHFTLIKAFEQAPAAVVAPFNYAHLLWATAVGFAVFGDLPDGWTLAGAGVIIASGLYIFSRENDRPPGIGSERGAPRGS